VVVEGGGRLGDGAVGWDVFVALFAVSGGGVEASFVIGVGQVRLRDSMLFRGSLKRLDSS